MEGLTVESSIWQYISADFCISRVDMGLTIRSLFWLTESLCKLAFCRCRRRLLKIQMHSYCPKNSWLTQIWEGTWIYSMLNLSTTRKGGTSAQKKVLTTERLYIMNCQADESLLIFVQISSLELTSIFNPHGPEYMVWKTGLYMQKGGTETKGRQRGLCTQCFPAAWQLQGETAAVCKSINPSSSIAPGIWGF